MAEQLLTYRPLIGEFTEKQLNKGVFIAVQHATRIPPHVGIIADGKYHSLSVKGQDVNVPVEAMLRNVLIRKIPCLFIQLKPHSTFSESYIGEHFVTNVQQFRRVDVGIATCLSPIKLLLNEVYGLQLEKVNFLFELLPLLDSEGMISGASGLLIDRTTYRLPVYSQASIDEGIELVRKEFRDQ